VVKVKKVKLRRIAREVFDFAVIILAAGIVVVVLAAETMAVLG